MKTKKTGPARVAGRTRARPASAARRVSANKNKQATPKRAAKSKRATCAANPGRTRPVFALRPQTAAKKQAKSTGQTTAKALLDGPQQLHKLLAQAGVASRREVNRWLEAGRLTIDGRVAEPWAVARGDEDIRLDAVLIKWPDYPQYSRILLYNKPAGELCTRSDSSKRRLVFDSLPSVKDGRWVAVGRLDMNSTGLLLFTNDGVLANKLMHPSSGIDREYAVRVLGQVTDNMLERLRAGVLLEDGLACFSDVRFFGGTGANRWYHVVIMEGKKREVRRLWESQGVRVSRLKRVRFGPVIVPATLPAGRWLEFGAAEVAMLYKFAGLKAHLPERATAKTRFATVLRNSKLFIPYPGLPGSAA